MKQWPHIFIDISKQELFLVSGDEIIRQYPVSTGARGTGFEEGSLKTPTGHFRIAEKIGAGAPPGTIFRSRIPSGCWPSDIPQGMSRDSDMVLSRILWLDGLDHDNKTTYGRYIYIHGTNHEDLLGTPASCGCIRMANDAMMELFDMVEVDTLVDISG